MLCKDMSHIVVKPIDNGIAQILALIGNGNNTVKIITPGIYEINNFNGDMYIISKFDEYPDLENLNPYGVCDTYEQILEQEPLLSDNVTDRKFVIFITPVVKSEQPESGGWRWHKWGPYIGNQNPTTEYLYDDPEIEKVYVYHIYEIKE